MPEPIVVEWFISRKGKRIKVNIFEFIKNQMEESTTLWNIDGLGAINFPRGRLTINWYDRPVQKYSAIEMEIMASRIKAAGELGYEEFNNALQYFSELLKSEKMVEFEKEAYKLMQKDMEDYFKKEKALVLQAESSYRSFKNKAAVFHKMGGTGKRIKAWWGSEKRTEKGYSSLWEQFTDLVLRAPPKVAGGAVLSYSLGDLMRIEVPSMSSPLRSIFMMEEFGTGLYADSDLRRPFVSQASTPWKVPPQIAEKYGMPEAIYMWWTYGSTRQKALLLFAEQQQKSTALRWIDRAKLVRTGKDAPNTLKGYRKWAYDRIDRYKEQRKSGNSSSIMNPLEFAYGNIKGGAFGYKGRQARHLFYGRAGFQPKIIEIQTRGYQYLLKLIDKEMQSKYPLWPSLAELAFPTRGLAAL